MKLLLPCLCLTALLLGGCLAGNPRYQTDSKKYHIVEKGDTLSKIANANGTSVKKIMLYNNLVSDLIFPGQKLYLYPKINGKNEYITVRSVPKKGYHLVKQKETLQRISRMYNLSILDLLDYNSKNSFEINVGERVWLVHGKITAGKVNIGKIESEYSSTSMAKSTDSKNKVVAEKKSVTKNIPVDLKNEDLAKSNKPEPKVDKANKTKTESKSKPESKTKLQPIKIPKSGKVIIPVNGTVTSEFGMRKGKPHKGIDIAAPKGTPIIAALPGKAVYVGSQRGYGNVVIIEHKNLIMTVYAHNEANLIRLGDQINKGQPIATVGDTGIATGPHLHFEYRVQGKAINPREVLPKF